MMMLRGTASVITRCTSGDIVRRADNGAIGWFSDVPDDCPRIDAIRSAKTEGLFQGL